ncbi:MAG: cytochrome c, partial [Gammaproteobacteria bacterium]|nr:cytochrome c [Gammaproteobacteria bacterium]
VVLLVIASDGLVLAHDSESLSPRLTPRLQELLRKEMQFIDEASQNILTALVAGSDAQVATLAQQIHDSFILRQSMTPEDKNHLVTVAPEGFVQRDRDFHQVAAELAAAARTGNRALQHQQFGRMIEACSTCHALYASDRFSGFSE